MTEYRYKPIIDKDQIKRIQRAFSKGTSIRFFVNGELYVLEDGWKIVKAPDGIKSSIRSNFIELIRTVIDISEISRSILANIDVSKYDTIIEVFKEYNRRLQCEINYHKEALAIANILMNSETHDKILYMSRDGACSRWYTVLILDKYGNLVYNKYLDKVGYKFKDLRANLSIDKNLEELNLKTVTKYKLVNRVVTSYRFDWPSIAYADFVNMCYRHILDKAEESEASNSKHVLRRIEFGKYNDNKSSYFDFIEAHVSLCIPADKCVEYVQEHKSIIYHEILERIESYDKFKESGMSISQLEVGRATITKARDFVVMFQWKSKLEDAVSALGALMD